MRRPRKILKLPALQRAEARERLQSVVEISHVTGDQKAACVVELEDRATISDGGSLLEKEW